MVKQAQTLNLRRWSSRTHTRVGLPVVIAVLFSIAIVQLWTSNSHDLEFTTAEQHGVVYLKPLTELMDQVITAQSVSVRGSTIDAAGLRDAMSRVDQAERVNGASLSTKQRWSDVRTRIDYLISLRPTSDVAYRSYTDVVQLIEDLIRKIADTSDLILDPTLDSYYLMDSAVLRLPGVLAFAGRAADLASLGTKLNTGSATATAADAQAQADTRVSVARYQVSLESDEIASGLRKALDITTSQTLGPNITNQLDTFRTAVDAFVPPVNLLQNLERVDTATVTANGERVREAARKLTASVLNELDRLLTSRADSQSITRSQGLGLGALCLLLTGLLLWMLLKRSDEAGSPASQGSTLSDGSDHKGPTDRQLDEGYGPRQARATEELVNVGRGIQARRRERTDDAR